jgi:predicted nuclease with RNAse H fold
MKTASQPLDLLAIDFGARLAGTTAVCFETNGKLHLLQSGRKQDADAWLRQIIEERQPGAVFIDAPLSLPPGCLGKPGGDFHFRTCDRLLNAMSPMFLGGLTARAMHLRSAFAALPFFETYPARLASTLFPEALFYKKEMPAFSEKLSGKMPFPFAKPPDNWHQIDAALAWLTGWRHGLGEAAFFGDEPEGMIWV